MRTKVGAALCAVAAIMVMAAGFSPRWLVSAQGVEGGAGLLGIEVCAGARPRAMSGGYGGGGVAACEEASWSELAAREPALANAKYGSLAAGAGTVALVAALGWVAVLGLATRRSIGASAIVTVVLAVGAAACGVAIAVFIKKALKSDRYAELGWSVYVYVAGAALGAVAAIVARRKREAAHGRAATADPA